MDYKRKTKIICTMGPSTDRDGVMEELVRAGMNVARFNFSHGDHEEQLGRLVKLREIRHRLHLPVAALLDTKGPEIRLRDFRDRKVMLEDGQTFTLTTRQVEGTNEIVTVSYRDLPKDVEVGSHILIDDGLVELEVTGLTDTDITCRVLNGGPVSNRKGVNVPNVDLTMDYLSEQDRSDLIFGCQEGFDFIAASFTRTAEDILEIKKILHEHGGDNIKIIAKIESNQGVSNIDAIIDACDGIMVARGDMGVEIPLEDVPILQKEIIKKTLFKGKLVVTATQMLDSMITHPRPTRAEAGDVANAVFDGTSAVMLSGETAAGNYPVQAVKTMARICVRTEQDINYKARLKERGVSAIEAKEEDGVALSIAHTACTLAADIDAVAIINVTKSGHSCTQISKFRPANPIIACCTDKQVMRQMNLYWGVTPVMIETESDIDRLLDDAVEAAVRANLMEKDQLAVVTAGLPLAVEGKTNLLKVHQAR
ncbi:pyruvate kinase [Shuttleworthella satelles]|uniref:Pyruvate kinase n=1 Tax=Shuttleworthella satelles DSM 14600 TaxID=626523 RepID=C4GCK0_9FIRM|nr:pyruvate kinase [Shuttleworthia satelles]EEP27700.1 pyruvate kinase [Shuttleworthia satelles DSM 14600]